MSAGIMVNAMPRENPMAVVEHGLPHEIHIHTDPFPCCPPFRATTDKSPLKLQDDGRFDPAQFHVVLL